MTTVCASLFDSLALHMAPVAMASAYAFFTALLLQYVYPLGNLRTERPGRQGGMQCRGTSTQSNVTVLSLSALAITLTDDSAIAAAATTGDSRSPNAG
jgi:hypothetical protein